MKTLFTLFLTLFITIGSVYAAAFEKEANHKNTKVYITASKSLAVGSNALTFTILHEKKPLQEARVSLKVFMPAMPGMPAMNYTTEAKGLGDGRYEADVNFSMSGTWQMYIFIMPDSGKKIRVKTSVNL